MSAHEPAWLIAAVDQRIAQLTDKFGDLILTSPQVDVVFSPLTEPPDSPDPRVYERWDKGCDGCGKYLPRSILSGHVYRKIKGRALLISFGTCRPCMERP